MENTDQKALPIDTIFKLPSPIPDWPKGDGFASGTIDLGGLQVRQVSTFNKIWATYSGGPNDQGATFFEPSSIPHGFFMLGSYCQSNTNPLFGWVLVGKDVINNPSSRILSKPIDYSLDWSSEPLEKLNHNVPGYIWLPTPRKGYKAVGHVVTTSPDKPSLDKVRCVRADFTNICLKSKWIWGEGKECDPGEFNVYGLMPRNYVKEAGSLGVGVGVGTFIALINSRNGNPNHFIYCLKNNNITNLDLCYSVMPNLSQVSAILEAYSPLLYFHPRQTSSLTSSSKLPVDEIRVSEEVKRGKLAYSPFRYFYPRQTSSLTSSSKLPVDEIRVSEEVKRGKLEGVSSYVHAKPIFGGTFSDIQIWTSYRFNDPAIPFVSVMDESYKFDIKHVTLQVSNFDGVLYGVCMVKHSEEVWIDSSSLEFTNGCNKFAMYVSLRGHASYPSGPELLEAQGTNNAGIGDDVIIDTRDKYTYVEAGKKLDRIVHWWLDHATKWGLEKIGISGI